MRNKGLENIDSVLQTGFQGRFSQAGLLAIALGIGGVTLSVIARVCGMLFSPCAPIGDYDVAIVSFPAFLGFLFLQSFAIVATAGDLAIAEAGMRVERFRAERAAFFFES